MVGDGARATRNPNDNTRLIFPLVAEPSPQRGRFGMAIAGVVIGVVLLGAVVAALNQLDQNPGTGGVTAAASDADRTASPANDAFGRNGNPLEARMVRAARVPDSPSPDDVPAYPAR